MPLPSRTRRPGPAASGPPRAGLQPEVSPSANNRIAGGDYPYFPSRSWGDHYRATRIAQLVAAKDRAAARQDAIGVLTLSPDP